MFSTIPLLGMSTAKDDNSNEENRAKQDKDNCNGSNNNGQRNTNLNIFGVTIPVHSDTRQRKPGKEKMRKK